MPNRKTTDGCTNMAQHEPSLPANRAFVVQFRTETDMERGHCTGRVEHVVSGQATHFQALDELLTFMTQILTKMCAPPHRRSRGGR
jgi:hypothetical protein